MAQTVNLPDTLTDEQMNQLSASSGLPDTLTDDEINQLSTPTPQPKRNIFKTIGSALISSEKGFAESAVSAFGPSNERTTVDTAIESGRLVDQAKKLQIGDPRRKQLLQQANLQVSVASGQAQERVSELPSNKKVLGQAAGVVLDVATAGTLGQGAKSFNLVKAAKDVATGTKAVKAATYGGRVTDILKKTGINALKGGGIGYGYDVSTSLQQDKGIGESLKPGLGTALGAGIPTAFGSFNVGRETFKTVGKETAPRLINSLIKPLGKDFSYGKNPGQAVADEGIVANSWDDLIFKIHDRRNSVGSQLEKVANYLDNPPIQPRLGQQVKVSSFEDILSPIDAAMKEANKSPRTNSSLLQRLSDVKKDILGVEIRDGQEVVTRDLNNLSFGQKLEIKRLIGDLTKWTGNVSDDKAVNGTLKRVYGVANEILTSDAEKRGKGDEWRKLSEKYANLTSAEVAARYRDKLLERQDLISLKGHIGLATGVISTILSGGAALPVVLAGASGAVLDKVLGSVAVKTRVAAWLAKESPTVLEKFFNANPNVAKSIYKAFHGENSNLDDLVKGAVLQAKKNPESGFVRFGKLNPSDSEVVKLASDLLDDLSGSGVGTGLDELAALTGNDKFKTLKTKTAIRNELEKLINAPEYKGAFDALKSLNLKDEPLKKKVEPRFNKDSKGLFSGSKPLPKEVGGLVEEARRYKSAEEFVRAKQLVYHGSPVPLKKFSNRKGGVFFTDSMEDASGFGGSPDNVYEGYLNLRKPLVIDAKGAKWDKLNTKWGKSTQEIISNAEKEGYDGVTFKNIVDNIMDTEDVGGTSTIHYVYKPEDAFVNESQLKELWNKANKSSPYEKLKK